MSKAGHKFEQDIKIGIYLAVVISVLVISIVCLNEAFALMSRKSDRDLYLGLLLFIVLLAFDVPIFRILFRKITGKDSKSE
jgi:hypothetical protein